MVCLRATSFNTVLLNPSVVCKHREVYLLSHSSVGRFSAVLDGGNTVTRVFYSNKENVAVVAFKKKIAELFSGNTNDM